VPAATGPKMDLLDHLIGTGNQRRQDVEAERGRRARAEPKSAAREEETTFRVAAARPPRRAAFNRRRTRPAAGLWTGYDGTAVRLSASGAVLHNVAHQVVHVVLQIPDDVLDDVSDRDHAHDLARV